MFRTVLSDPTIQGDYWKIYPTQVTFTEMADYNTEYIPYPAVICNVILEAKPNKVIIELFVFLF